MEKKKTKLILPQVISLVVLLVIFGWISVYVFTSHNDLPALDERVFEGINMIRGAKGDASYWFFRIITETARYYVVLPVIVLIGYLCFHFDRRFWFLLLGSVFNDLIGFFLKYPFHRTRPDVELAWVPEWTPSFPSGHIMTVAFVCGFLLFLLYHDQKQRAALKIYATLLAFVYACTIAISRLVLGAHYLTDVLAGATLGFIVMTIVIIIYKLTMDKTFHFRSKTEKNS